MIHPFAIAEAPTATIGPSMNRCECTGVTFAEAERRMRQDGISLPELTRRTGCGGNCTACLYDLQRFLADAHSS